MASSSQPDASLAYAVFRHGLRLKERLRLGSFDMGQEQAELRRLVRNAEAAGPPDPPVQSRDRYLGVGYPLACWLDDIFIFDPKSPWKGKWADTALEFALYNSRDRAFKFWEQAAQAEARSDEVALEVFYLCMMLGFRGDLRDDPKRLLEWRDRLETHLPQPRADAWPDMPIERPIPLPNVPARRARDRLRWLFIASGLVVAGLIVAVVFTLMRQWLGSKG